MSYLSLLNHFSWLISTCDNTLCLHINNFKKQYTRFYLLFIIIVVFMLNPPKYGLNCFLGCCFLKIALNIHILCYFLTVDFNINTIGWFVHLKNGCYLFLQMNSSFDNIFLSLCNIMTL